MLSDNKILESERNAIYVKSTEGSRLTGTVVENKNVFDKFPQLIMNKYNELVDLLIAFGIDNIVTDLANRYTKSQVNSLIDTETGKLVSEIELNPLTGVITIITKDGTISTIDTVLEKVPATFEFVEDIANDKYYIKVTNVDGTSSQTEVTNLMNQYTFTSGDQIQFTASKNGTTISISASINAGSVTMTELDAAVKEYFDNLAATVASDKSTVSADKQIVVDASHTVTSNTAIVLEAKQVSVDNANLSRSYAAGGTGTRDGENTDNAMYYANKAETSEFNAAQYAQGAYESAKNAALSASAAAESEANAEASKETAETASSEAQACLTEMQEIKESMITDLIDLKALGLSVVDGVINMTYEEG